MSRKGEAMAVVVLAGMVLIWMAAVGGMVYVAGHFVAKFW